MITVKLYRIQALNYSVFSAINLAQEINIKLYVSMPILILFDIWFKWRQEDCGEELWRQTDQNLISISSSSSFASN